MTRTGLSVWIISLKEISYDLVGSKTGTIFFDIYARRYARNIMAHSREWYINFHYTSSWWSWNNVTFGWNCSTVSFLFIKQWIIARFPHISVCVVVPLLFTYLDCRPPQGRKIIFSLVRMYRARHFKKKHKLDIWGEIWTPLKSMANLLLTSLRPGFHLWLCFYIMWMSVL